MKRINVLTGIFLLSMVISAHAVPIKIAVGKKVTMDYITKIDGQVVETTVGKKPLTFVAGDGQLLPALAKKLNGLKAGDTKVIKLSAKEGFGEVIKEAVHEFPTSAFPAGTKYVKGNLIQAQGPDGKQVAGTIVEANAEKVVVDFNHPFAGKSLDIEVKILSVE
jgi:FKBP-type peptidyl-prolyl cis-trans isomerase SlyD